ncbi:hypothetical protein BZB76_4045 [Actinomadura pelletieri DSM 43383]|uniref:Acetone carboxylase n=1 Tax=Actinomadura pelletieri DSM 43383 TaxID=1120940 RepID=A0A495QLA0_9ACTN|nr:hypothetical protein [Actinomadura pelletieri]RKS73355.1 hypothetical protein BZB76_4045 [Actinomadura pelletieri DSM 43383]
MTESGPDELQCSAKGCRADAVWALRWNNPKIHTTDRRKIWFACDDHRESLSTFLARRNFLKDVVPVADRDTPPTPDTP